MESQGFSTAGTSVLANDGSQAAPLEHAVEDDQFAHASGVPEPQIEVPIGFGAGRKRGHVQGLTSRRPTSPHGAPPADPAVAVERGDPEQARDLLAGPPPAASCFGPTPRTLRRPLAPAIPGSVGCVAQVGCNSFSSQAMWPDVLADRPHGAAQTVLAVIIVTTCRLRSSAAPVLPRRANGWAAAAWPCRSGQFQPVRLGQPSACLRAAKSRTWRGLTHRRRDLRRGEPPPRPAAVRRFQHHQHRRQGSERGDQFVNSLRRVGDAPLRPGRTAMSSTFRRDETFR